MIEQREQLIDLACQISFNDHNRVQTATGQTGLAAIQEVARAALEQNKNDGAVLKSLAVIQEHVRRKYESSWTLWFGKIFGLASALHKSKQLEDFLSATQCAQPPVYIETEEQARVVFFASHAKKLGIKHAAKEELDVVKICSQTFWECSHNKEDKYNEHFLRYAKLMEAYFSGEHFLIADDGDLTNKLKGLKNNNGQPIAYLRSSSHYDYGSKDHLKGGTIPETEAIALEQNVEPQFELTGPQVKALLFSKVCLKTIENGSLKLQIDQKGKATVLGPRDNKADSFNKTFSWLQTEWAPDSADWLEMDFWKHRVLSFGLYVIRKLLKLEKPNIGPYGYGHGDPNAGGVGPTMLDPKKKTIFPNSSSFPEPIIADKPIGADEP